MFQPLEDALIRGDDLDVTLNFMENGTVSVQVFLDGDDFYSATDFTSVDDALQSISETVKLHHHKYEN